MRIALTNPYCWPEVRRGSERFLHELGCRFTDLGYDVTTVSTHRGPYLRTKTDEGTIVRLPQKFSRSRFPRMWGPPHAFALQCKEFLSRETFDIVHCMSYYDAYGAARAKRNGASFKLIMHHVGIPVKRYFRSIPHDYIMFRYAMRHADELAVVSTFAAEKLSTEFGYSGHITRPFVDLDIFTPKTDPGDAPPTILFVGDADEVRKGARCLARAFSIVKATCPDSKLRFSGHATGPRIAQLLREVPNEYHESVEFLGVGDVGDLSDQYRAASVTVLPAIWEPYGMVLAESLACGTPVVGCDHAGISDVITNDAVGALFRSDSLHGEPDNPEGLAEALLKALALARDPGTIPRCTEHARSFAWSAQRPAFEAMYGDGPSEKAPANHG